MRKEPYGVGSIIHVIKRGVKGIPFVQDETDRWRYLLMLRHFNDKHWHRNWFRDLVNADLQNTLKRPDFWPEQKQLVKVHAFTLLDNHFHMVLEEIIKGGISSYLARVGSGISHFYNEKYKGSGTVFQGAYRSRTVHFNSYLRVLAAYVMVKNSFEMYPQGYDIAINDFDTAFKWAKEWPYTSLGDYFGKRTPVIVDTKFLSQFLGTEQALKNEAKELMIARGDLFGIELGELKIEE